MAADEGMAAGGEPRRLFVFNGGFFARPRLRPRGQQSADRRHQREELVPQHMAFAHIDDPVRSGFASSPIRS